MKVLTVTNMYPQPGREGWGAFVKSQVQSLEQAGVQTNVLVIDGWRSKLEYIAAMHRIRQQCRLHRYDLIHAHYGLSGLAARAEISTPLVVSFCGDDLYGHADGQGQPTPSSLFWVQMHRLLSLTADAVIAKSEGLRHRVPRRDVAVIPNGVDLELFRPIDRKACRQRLGLDPEALYLLFPYDPQRPRKNFKTVQEIANRLATRCRGSRKVEVLVAYGQPQDMMPFYMNAADILVLASFWEGSPNVVKEALACDMQVVATDVGDVRALTVGVAGARVVPVSQDAIFAAVVALLATPDQTGGRAAVTHLSLPRIAEQVLDVYRSVLARRHKAQDRLALH